MDFASKTTIWRHRGRKHVQNISCSSRAAQGCLLKRKGTRHMDVYLKPARLANAALEVLDLSWSPRGDVLLQVKVLSGFHPSRTSSKVPILSA